MENPPFVDVFRIGKGLCSFFPECKRLEIQSPSMTFEWLKVVSGSFETDIRRKATEKIA